MSIVAKRLDGSRCHLVRMYRPGRRPHCVRWRPRPPLLGPCILWPESWMDQDTTWYEVGLPLPPRKGAQHPPTCWPTLLWHGRPSQLLLSTCFTVPADKHDKIHRWAAHSFTRSNWKLWPSPGSRHYHADVQLPRGVSIHGSISEPFQTYCGSCRNAGANIAVPGPYCTVGLQLESLSGYAELLDQCSISG